MNLAKLNARLLYLRRASIRPGIKVCTVVRAVWMDAGKHTRIRARRKDGQCSFVSKLQFDGAQTPHICRLKSLSLRYK